MHIGLRPRFLLGLIFFCLVCLAMPPKNTRKAADRGEELEPVRETSEVDLITSPLSSASSYSTASGSSRSSATVSSEQLELILAANNKSLQASMTALVAALTPPVPVSSPAPSYRSQVKIPKWTDEEIPYEYFTKFEKALTHNGVDKAAWGQLLPVYLAGRAQAALAQVPSASLDDYEAVKTVLLESLGDTPASADRKWWSLYRQPGEDAGSFYLRVRAIGIRRLQGLSSKEEILEKLVLSRFMSLLPPDSYSSAMARQPKDGLEAARIVQELEETKAYSRRRQAWRQDHNHHNTQASRREPAVNSSSSPNDGGSGSSSSDGQIENFVSDPGDSGSHGAVGGMGFSGDGSQKDVVSGRGQSSDGYRYQESMGRRPAGRQVTCHGCGEVGHIRPNCPNRIRRVVVKGAGPGLTVDGFLAGRPVSSLKVDTGSGRTLVHRDFIPGACYTGRNVRLGDWKGGLFSSHRTAKIEIQVGDVEDLVEVVVVDSLDCPAVLGNDLGSKLHLTVIKLVLDKLEVDPVDCDNNVVPMQSEEVRVNFVEASVAPVDEVKVEVEQFAVAEAQSEEDPVILSEIFDFSCELFEEDPLPELSVRNDDSCPPIVKGGQIIEDQADAVVCGPVEYKSVELLDVSDSYLVPDPVLTSVSEVKLEFAEEFLDIPLTKEGRMSSESCWQSSDLVDSDQRFLHYYAKATGRLAPDCSAVIHCLLFLFLRFLLFVPFVLKFSMCMYKFLVQQFVGDTGPRSVLWFHRTGEELPLTSSSSPLLPRTGIGGYVSLPCVSDNTKGGEML